MPISITFEPENNLITGVYSGELSPEDILQSALNEHSHPDFRPGMDSLGDFTGAKLVSLNFDIIFNYSKHMGAIGKVRGRCRWAMVSPSLATYGILRMFTLINHDGPIEMKVFKSLDEGKAWLAQPTGHNQGG